MLYCIKALRGLWRTVGRFVLLFCLLLGSVFSSADSGQAKAGKPLIVASIHPLRLMANDLAGDWLDVEMLLEPGQEPHHLALSISQRRKLDDADLVLWIGPAMETFLVKILRGMDSTRQLSFQDTLEGAVAINPNDPHYWVHPQLAAGFYRALAATLAIHFPDRADQIQLNLQRALETLAETSKGIESRVRAAPPGKVIVDHQAYSYFAQHYQIPIAGALTDESGVSAGPRTIAGLLSQTGVRCVVAERLPAPKRAQKLAMSLGVPLVAIDPLGTNIPLEQGFTGLLTDVATGFEHCLDPQ
jgi:zinc transport system substrate-binding protein